MTQNTEELDVHVGKEKHIPCVLGKKCEASEANNVDANLKL